MEQLKAFIEKAESDNELKEKISELDAKNAAADEYVSLAAEAGFTVIAQELEEKKKQRELSEEQLEGVAGGGDENGDRCYFTPTEKQHTAPVPGKGFDITWAECKSWCVGVFYDCSCHKAMAEGEAICVNKWHQLQSGGPDLWPIRSFNHSKKKPPSYNT